MIVLSVAVAIITAAFVRLAFHRGIGYGKIAMPIISLTGLGIVFQGDYFTAVGGGLLSATLALQSWYLVGEQLAGRLWGSAKERHRDDSRVDRE